MHDPRRVLAGTLTPLLTWGVFGYVTGGVPSMIASGLLGAACGGFYAYRGVHHASKLQLEHLGAALSAPSSALLTFAETSEAGAILDAAASQATVTAASAALIADGLSAKVIVADENASEDRQGRDEERLRMILLRYPASRTAEQVAARIAAERAAAGSVEVELVARTDETGHSHVSDPRFGSGALGRSNVISWGGLGLVCGAIAGISGGGVLGLISGGLVTAIVWGLFGLAAGALYGLWAGRAVSARRLKPISGILAPGTSTLLAWTDEPIGDQTTAILDPSPGTQRLILGFKPAPRGVKLDVSQT